MKKLTNISVLAFAIFLLSSIDGFSQESPLQNPSNYKTQSAAKRAAIKSEGNGVLTESVEATNYKRPQQKTKTKRVNLETSSSPKRNYKMKNTKV